MQDGASGGDSTLRLAGFGAGLRTVWFDSSDSDVAAASCSVSVHRAKVDRMFS